MSEAIVLRFMVSDTILKKDLSTPFNEMKAGSGTAYMAEFELNDAWRGYSCVACFKTENQVRYVPLVGGKADIPEDILKHKTFAVSVIGQKNGVRLTTNENKVIQTGGK